MAQTQSNNEISSSSSQSSLTNRRIQDNQEEENLFNTIELLIHQYLCQTHHRRQPYWTRIRWFYNDGTDLSYHVSLVIDEDILS